MKRRLFAAGFCCLELGGWERFYFCFSLVVLPDDEKALA
jgi:hypothetical protein